MKACVEVCVKCYSSLTAPKIDAHKHAHKPYFFPLTSIQPIPSPPPILVCVSCCSHSCNIGLHKWHFGRATWPNIVTGLTAEMLPVLVAVRLGCLCLCVRVCLGCMLATKQAKNAVSLIQWTTDSTVVDQHAERPTDRRSDEPTKQSDSQATTTAPNRVEPLQNWIQYEFQVSLCKRMSGSDGEITFRAIWRWAGIHCIYCALPHCYIATTLHRYMTHATCQW